LFLKYTKLNSGDSFPRAFVSANAGYLKG